MGEQESFVVSFELKTNLFGIILHTDQDLKKTKNKNKTKQSKTKQKKQIRRRKYAVIK